MARLSTRELCTGCAACASVCPQNCIEMKADEEGFLRPVVDDARCVDCAQCTRACPICTPMERKPAMPTACAAINTDERMRMTSTSGGVFSLLSRWVIHRGGAVWGAAYGKDHTVVHRCAEREEETAAFQSAKYAQSDGRDAYREVKKQLEQGRYVLFSGTPCQIDGLRTFLRKEYETLILVDLICHGVPSPAVWAHYLDYRSQNDASGAGVRSVNLRSKVSGWPGYSIQFEYENGAQYCRPNSRDPFLRCFVGDLCLRPSCYHCLSKGAVRNSDFTLGDYWGVWAQAPDLHDGKGTSLVLLHSEKAKEIWRQLSQHMKIREVGVEEALRENPSALRSSVMTEGRMSFMGRYQSEDFALLVDELLPQKQAEERKRSMLRRAVSRAKRMLNKLC